MAVRDATLSKPKTPSEFVMKLSPSGIISPGWQEQLDNPKVWKAFENEEIQRVANSYIAKVPSLANGAIYNVMRTAGITDTEQAMGKLVEAVGALDDLLNKTKILTDWPNKQASDFIESVYAVAFKVGRKLANKFINQFVTDEWKFAANRVPEEMSMVIGQVAMYYSRAPLTQESGFQAPAFYSG